jgi:hypothetical protein
MTPSPASLADSSRSGPDSARIDSLDATRSFALLLGVIFHASLSFVPMFMGWAVQDVSTSPWVTSFTTVSHSFRMELFFLLAGFLSRNSVQRQGTWTFLRARLVRIGVPFVFGWFLLRPLLVAGWILGSMSLRGTVDIPGAFRGGIQSLSTLPDGLFTGTHLWFLYYLILVSALVVVGHHALAGFGSVRDVLSRWADAVLGWTASAPLPVLAFCLPTALLLGGMQTWSVDTPDRSLRPHVPVLLLYGGCFLLGWTLASRRDRLDQLVRITPMRVILASLGIAVVLGLGGIERNPAHPHYTAAHLGYGLGYAITLWSLVFLTLGVFMRFFLRPNAAVRYVADASYWTYWIHLPIVVGLQVCVAEWPLHWSVKLAGISLATLALALVTYDFGVRSTWIGRMMNGRRRDRVLWPWFREFVRGTTGPGTARSAVPPVR